MSRGEGGLELSALGDARIEQIVGEGASCSVYLACWRDRPVALKIYRPDAVTRHARLTGEDLAEYEYRRNLAFYRAPGLGRYVAEPLAWLSTGAISVFAQQWLDGVLYLDYHGRGDGAGSSRLFEQIRRIVDLAHAAGLYDVDLHAGNVMVVTAADGEPLPKLFDFNFIPFYVHAPNPLTWLLVKTGVLDLRARDRRKLRTFHDFRRIERAMAARRAARA